MQFQYQTPVSSNITLDLIWQLIEEATLTKDKIRFSKDNDMEGKNLTPSLL